MRTAANILLLIVAVAVHVIWIRSLVEWDGSPCDAAATAASVAATIATTAVQQLAAEAPAAESKTE